MTEQAEVLLQSINTLKGDAAAMQADIEKRPYPGHRGRGEGKLPQCKRCGEVRSSGERLCYRCARETDVLKAKVNTARTRLQELEAAHRLATAPYTELQAELHAVEASRPGRWRARANVIEMELNERTIDILHEAAMSEEAAGLISTID